ncbi:MAG TPA: cytochrome P450 [Gemmatimonadaceae bacterium]|jgi:cytochrome P450|nr:cytochrome P450 [Gemmatimonadaceae bacterium]
MEYLLEIGVLVALAVPNLRAATSSAYRRVFPFDAMRIGAGAVVYLVVIAAVAVYEPRWLRVPAVAAAIALAYLLWRARPAYGVAAKLPPGSLQPLPVGPWDDPEYYKRQSARYGDVFKTSQFGQPMVCVVGLDRANRLLLEHDHQLVAPPLPFSRFIEGGYLRYLPEETHASYRRFFRSIFYSEAMTNAEPRIAAVFREGFAAMVAESNERGSVAVRAPVMRMMFVAWAELFYGIGKDHPDFNRLRELFHVIDIRKARWASRRRIEPALAEIEAIIRRRASSLTSGDECPSCFLALLARNHPDALNDRTILGNLIYIMQVTWGDVTGLLLWVLKMLTDHPESRDRLALERSRDLATRIVQETLRLEQSESRYRRATADLELDGFRIPRNWLVRMCVRESHQDPAVFPDPHVFDPDRFVGRPFTRSQYAPFGAFRLACIGEEVTKRVASIFALELVTGFEWSVADDGPAQISSWAHNAPHRRFSVRITPRPAQ